MLPMFNKIRQSLSAREAFDLVHADLQEVEREIGVESIASVEAITTINQYLQAGGGKRLRPALLLLCKPVVWGADRLRQAFGGRRGDDSHGHAGARRCD